MRAVISQIAGKVLDIAVSTPVNDDVVVGNFGRPRHRFILAICGCDRHNGFQREVVRPQSSRAIEPHRGRHKIGLNLIETVEQAGMSDRFTPTRMSHDHDPTGIDSAMKWMTSTSIPKDELANMFQMHNCPGIILPDS